MLLCLSWCLLFVRTCIFFYYCFVVVYCCLVGQGNREIDRHGHRDLDWGPLTVRCWLNEKLALRGGGGGGSSAWY